MFGRIVVVILILLFVLLHLVGKIMIKKGKLSLGEIFSFLLFPVIFPLGFFIYGYLFASDPYIPKFFSWGANWDVLKLYSVYLAVMLVVQTIMVGVNHTAMIKGSTILDLVQIRTMNWIWISVKTVLGMAISAGLVEEMLFRFILLTALYPFAAAIDQWFDFSMFTQFVPAWVTLGANSAPAVLFAVALLSNLFFSLTHLSRLDGKKGIKLAYIPRVFNAWFMGWAFFLIMMSSGLFSAILFHIFNDLVLAGFGIYMYIWRVDREVRAGTFDYSLLKDVDFN